MHWTFFLQDELPTWNCLMTFLLTLKMEKKYLKKDKYTIFYFPLFKAIRFFLPLLPALEASCFPGLEVTDEDDTADVILSLMCSLILIMLLFIDVLIGHYCHIATITTIAGKNFQAETDLLSDQQRALSTQIALCGILSEQLF